MLKLNTLASFRDDEGNRNSHDAEDDEAQVLLKGFGDDCQDEISSQQGEKRCPNAGKHQYAIGLSSAPWSLCS
jgi:hypothetical protein